MTLRPSGPGAAHYLSPSPRPAAAGEPLRRALAQAVAEAAVAAGLPAPVRDTRLDRAADDIARGTPAGQQPSLELVAFLLSHYGVVEPQPNLVLMRGGLQPDKGIVDHLRPQLPAILRMGPNQRLGIGVLRGQREMVVVLAFQDQNLELRPLPRALRAGQVAAIAGRLRNGYRIPQVFVTPPSGPVDELRVSQSRGWFEARLDCGPRRGRFQIEVTATDARGPGVLANFPVYCAVAPPERSPPLSSERAAPQDPDDAASELLALINRDRKAVGLGPVRLDRRLSAVAQAHSQEMAATGAAVHVSPTTGSAADRVHRRGLNPQLVAENVGRAYNADQAQRGFMSSPGHRAAVLEPRVTHVGIGVAAGRPEGESVPLFFTQLFAGGL